MTPDVPSVPVVTVTRVPRVSVVEHTRDGPSGRGPVPRPALTAP